MADLQKPSSTTPAPAKAWNVALMGGFRRTGAWAAAAKMFFLTLVGGADLDLTQAVLPPHTTLRVITPVGGVSVTVPAGVSVEVKGFALFGGLFGGFRNDVGVVPNAEHVVVIKVALWFGGVKVHRAA